jgi:hypothetical protein
VDVSPGRRDLDWLIAMVSIGAAVAVGLIVPWAMDFGRMAAGGGSLLWSWSLPARRCTRRHSWSCVCAGAGPPRTLTLSARTVGYDHP